MVLAAAVAAAEEAGNDVGPQRADVADVVADDLVVPPLLDRFLDAEGEPEVHGAGEVLLRAVEAVHREELLGAEHAQRREELRTNLVLAAVAAGRGDEHRPHALAVPEQRQQPVVLVVGMRVGLHVGADRGELAQLEPQRGLAGQLADRLRPELRRRMRRAKAQREEASRQRERERKRGSQHGDGRQSKVRGRFRSPSA